MMTAVAADFDNDGWPDIYVACDSTPSFLLRNNHDGTFTDIGLESGVALNEDGNEQAGMGVGIGDFNLDGNLDILKTHFADDTSVLYRNTGKDSFDDVTIASGLGVETRFVGWGAGIVDLDNDGNPDLFLVTGGVYPELASKLPNYPMKTPRVIFRNLGNGKFEELLDDTGPASPPPHCSRGCAFGDFDNDGDMDVLIVNLNEPPSLLRNDVSGNGHWLKVKLTGVKSNRSAIGARVTARYGGKVQAQEVRQPVELLFRQRLAAALRLGNRRLRGPGDSLAQRRNGVGEPCRGRPARLHPGRVGDCEEGKVHAGSRTVRIWSAFTRS